MHIPKVHKRIMPLRLLPPFPINNLHAILLTANADLIRRNPHHRTQTLVRFVERPILACAIADPEEPQRREGRGGVGSGDRSQGREKGGVDDVVEDGEGDKEDGGQEEELGQRHGHYDGGVLTQARDDDGNIAVDSSRRRRERTGQSFMAPASPCVPPASVPRRRTWPTAAIRQTSLRLVSCGLFWAFCLQGLVGQRTALGALCTLHQGHYTDKVGGGAGGLHVDDRRRYGVGARAEREQERERKWGQERCGSGARSGSGTVRAGDPAWWLGLYRLLAR
jgi:hypothetical protein